MNGIHGDDPVRVHHDMREFVDDVTQRSPKEGRTIPLSRVRFMLDVARSHSRSDSPVEARRHP